MASDPDDEDRLRSRLAAVDAALVARASEDASMPFHSTAYRRLTDDFRPRLRALILLLVAEAVRSGRAFETVESDGTQSFTPAGLAVEFAHAHAATHASLTAGSRGSAGGQYGEDARDVSETILIGDFFLSRAFELLLETDCPPDVRRAYLRRLAAASRQVCETRAADVSSSSEAVDSGKITDAVRSGRRLPRHGSFLDVAAEIGALLGGGDDRTVEAAAAFGESFADGLRLLVEYFASRSTASNSGGGSYPSPSAPSVDDFREPSAPLSMKPSGTGSNALSSDGDAPSDASEAVPRQARLHLTSARKRLEAFPESTATGLLEKLATVEVLGRFLRSAE
ncbi:polyprenyl synthetase family protein [Halegenticoccus soli]|uniref:hypothetical protein n=1 Tax=Halegenticoccus soli TaxID=1985678 RepID=UPI000C6EE654|nr:hypothetical protein [Halegenticoccus soli]